MNLTKNTILAIASLALAAGLSAQTATETKPTGLLGQSFYQLEAGLTDVDGTSKNFYDVGLAANVPVNANVDVLGGYTYGWMRGVGHVNTLGGQARAYTNYAGLKPFVGAGLNYNWISQTGGPENFAGWNLVAGFEWATPYGFVLTPSVTYTDDFRSSDRSSQGLTYGVEANHWLTSTLAVFGDVSYNEEMHTNQDGEWRFAAGVRMKF